MLIRKEWEREGRSHWGAEEDSRGVTGDDTSQKREEERETSENQVSAGPSRWEKGREGRTNEEGRWT